MNQGGSSTKKCARLCQDDSECTGNILGPHCNLVSATVGFCGPWDGTYGYCAEPSQGCHNGQGLCVAHESGNLCHPTCSVADPNCLPVGEVATACYFFSDPGSASPTQLCATPADPAQAEGDVCVNPSDCATDSERTLQCVTQRDSTIKKCERFCQNDSDCIGGSIGATCNLVGEGVGFCGPWNGSYGPCPVAGEPCHNGNGHCVDHDQRQFCLPTCDLLAQDCPSVPWGTLTCMLLSNLRESPLIEVCLPITSTPPVQEGDACVLPSDCAPGLQCMDFGSGMKCARFCEDASVCQSSQACNLMWPSLGFCGPWDGTYGPCDPATPSCHGGLGYCADQGGTGTCLATCDILTQNCPSIGGVTPACYIISDPSEPPVVQVCLQFTASPPKDEGEACVDPTDCASGSECIDLEDGTGAKCFKFCGPSLVCTGTLTCFMFNDDIGLCACRPQEGMICVDNAVYWVDSCGVRGEKSEDCSNCVNNACGPWDGSYGSCNVPETDCHQDLGLCEGHETGNLCAPKCNIADQACRPIGDVATACYIVSNPTIRPVLALCKIPSDSQSEGETCIDPSDCTPGLQCVDFNSQAGSVCEAPCQSNADCGRGQTCCVASEGIGFCGPYANRHDSKTLSALFPPYTDDIHVSSNGRDFPKLLWSPTSTIDVSELGCSHDEPIDDLGLCVVTILLSSTGRSGLLSSLVNSGVTRSLPSGETLVQFQQTLGGIPVADSTISVTFAAGGAQVARVSSSLLDEIQYIVPFPPFEEGALSAAAALEEAELKSVIGPTFVVSEDNMGVRTANPSYFLHIATDNSLDAFAVIDASTMKLRERGAPFWQVPGPMEAIPVIESIATNVIAVEHTTSHCTSSEDCPSGYHCQTDQCMMSCYVDADCEAIGASWHCVLDYSSRFYHYCQGDNLQTFLPVYVSTTGWVVEGFEDFKPFAALQYVAHALNEWITGKLKSNSYDGRFSELKTHVLIATFDSGGNPGPAGRWNGSNIDVTLWGPGEYGESVDDYPFGLFGHEFGHAIFGAAGNAYLADECASESYAEFYSALFGANEFPSGWVSDGVSAFGDCVVGLDYANASAYGGRNIAGYLKYCYRSGFDNGKSIDANVLTVDRDDFTSTECDPNHSTLECQRHESCWPVPGTSIHRCNSEASYDLNKPLFKRFARILSKGTATFLENPIAGQESQGMEYEGVGLDRVAEIYSTVIQSKVLNGRSSLEDFGFQLGAASGADHERTQKALGAIGMPAGIWDLRTVPTDRAVALASFPEWMLSPNKQFSAVRVSNTGIINISFYVGAQSPKFNLSANTDSSPVMEIYREVLYLFWRNADDGSIRFRTISRYGEISTEMNLGSLALTTTGDFDAAVFNGSLYLVFVEGVNGAINVSRCTVTGVGACTADATYWSNWEGLYKYVTPWRGYPGLAAASAVNLNGDSMFWGQPADGLYIAFADKSTALGGHRIAVVRLSATETWYREMPIYLDEHEPSIRTSTRIAMISRSSALLPGRSHLYLFWKDLNSERLFGSVLQRWDTFTDYTYSRPRNGPEPYWYTRPREFYSMPTRNGVSFMRKGTGEAGAESIDLGVTSGSSAVRIPFFGRY